MKTFYQGGNLHILLDSSFDIPIVNADIFLLDKD
jgi:hypothetical protein